MQCPSRTDGHYGAIVLNDSARMTFGNGSVQCINASAFVLDPSPSHGGAPQLTLTGTTIQNVGGVGLDQANGMAVVSNSVFRYNFNAVAAYGSGVDLSGGDAGGRNTIACNSGVEVPNGTAVGAGVYSYASTSLDARNIDWDTPGPDQFECSGFPLQCVCAIAECTKSAGADGIDLEYVNAAPILTSGNGMSNLDCTVDGGSAGGH